MAETGKTLALDLPDEDSQSLWFVTTAGVAVHLDGELATDVNFLNERETTVLKALLDLARDRVAERRHHIRMSFVPTRVDRSGEDSS